MQISTISIKIPTELDELLTFVSKKQDRSKSSLVRLAVQEYLEDIEDAMIGEEVLNKIEKGKAGFTSFEDLKKKIGYVED